MAVSKISVSFHSVTVADNPDLWGPGGWYFSANVDGKAVGDSVTEFEARPRQEILLEPQAPWSSEVDVSGKGAGSTIDIQFSTRASGATGDVDLGQASITLKYPYKEEFDLTLPGSQIGGHSAYGVNVVMTIKEEKATAPRKNAADIFISRQADGTTTFSSVSGKPRSPRVEVCPVVPVPVRGMPQRPHFPVGYAAGKRTPQAAKIKLTPGLALNALPNPAVIPILAAGDPDLAKKAARIAVTYVEPGNIDTSYLTWVVKSGPVVFEGETKGKTEVLAFGTGAGATDEEAIIELRWGGDTGPLLCTYRAWVGRIKQIPYRVLICTPKKWRVRTKPADAKDHVGMANVLLWHAGLTLVPDTDTSTWDGVTDCGDAVYQLEVAGKTMKFAVGVNENIPPITTKLNFRPGVMHFVYIKTDTTPGDCGIATDRPGLDGKKESLAGSPSPSWVRPSGIPPDGAARTVHMKTIAKSSRGKSKSDKDYLKARGLPVNAMDQLFGLLLPDYTIASDPDWGQTLAHESGHVLGLAHRGNAAAPGASATTPPAGAPIPSVDTINDPSGNGYPWWENVMCYGFVKSQDLDIIQAVVIRRHPLCT
jgi:hypothetical protein